MEYSLIQSVDWELVQELVACYGTSSSNFLLCSGRAITNEKVTRGTSLMKSTIHPHFRCVDGGVTGLDNIMYVECEWVVSSAHKMLFRAIKV